MKDWFERATKFQFTLAAIFITSVLVVGFVAVGGAKIVGRAFADVFLGANQAVSGYQDRVKEIDSSGEPLPINEAWEGSSLKQLTDKAVTALDKAMAANPSEVTNGGGSALDQAQATVVPPPDQSQAPIAATTDPNARDPYTIEQIVNIMKRFRLDGDYVSAIKNLKGVTFGSGTYPEFDQAWAEVQAFKTDFEKLGTADKVLMAPTADLNARVAEAQVFNDLADSVQKYVTDNGMASPTVDVTIQAVRELVARVNKAAKGYNTYKDAVDAKDVEGAATALNQAFAGSKFKITAWKDVVVSMSGDNGLATIEFISSPSVIEGITFQVSTDVLKKAFPDEGWVIGEKVGKVLTFQVAQ